MRVVLDCNVLISAARTDGVCRAVVVEVVRHHEIVLSAPILEEYRAVAMRPKHASSRRTALAGEADTLITGNVRHFPEEACGNVTIMTPRAFLDRKS